MKRGIHWNMTLPKNVSSEESEERRQADWLEEKLYRHSRARACTRSLHGKQCLAYRPTGKDCPGCTGLIRQYRIWDHESMWLDRDGKTVLVLQPYLRTDSSFRVLEDGDGRIALPPFTEPFEAQPEFADLQQFCSEHKLTFKLEPEWSWHYPGWTTLIEVRRAVM